MKREMPKLFQQELLYLTPAVHFSSPAKVIKKGLF